MAFFNPFRQAYLDEPYDALKRLRETEPVHWSAEVGAWVVTRYEDCLRVIQDDAAFSPDPGNAGGEFGAEVARKRQEAPLGFAPIMGNSDPPDHTRLRSVVNRGFTPRVIEGARPAVERAVGAILEELPANEPFDVVSNFAEPLAVTTVLAHLGVPQESFGMFRAWSLAIMRARAEGASQPGVVEAAGQAAGEMLDYLAHLAEQREGAESSTDVLSVLLEACDSESIRPEEMMMMLIHISLAGNGPTAMALGNAFAALGGNPGAQQEVRDDPGLIGSTIEELLRFDSSTHFVVRFARAEVKLGGRIVRAGQQVHAMIGAANRDPARFPNPDALDIRRVDNRHLAFGHGTHFCLGAPLARLELQVALAKFVDAYGPFRVVAGQRAPSYQLRGYQSLVVQSQPKH